MNEETELLAEKLDTLIQLTAISLIEGKKQRDQIRLLGLAGIKPSRIAEIINTSPNTVNVALSNLRKDGFLPRSGKERHKK